MTALLTTSPPDYLVLLEEGRRLVPGPHPRKVALLADATCEPLALLMKALYARSSLSVDVWAAPYGAIETEVYAPDSDLARFRADVVVLLRATQHLWTYYCERPEDRATMAERLAQEQAALWDALAARTQGTVLQCNFVVPTERVFGHFDLKVESSFTSILQRLNGKLAELASARPFVLLCDVDGLASHIGKRTFLDERAWTLWKSPCALDELPALAQSFVQITLPTFGRSAKVVVLDLDNTLWGGIVGDDGIEGIAIGPSGDGEPYYRFQLYLRELCRRGILLAVCSKNEEALARRVFREHPSMVLREDNLVAFKANWDSKVDNLKAIQKELNVGLDSMVFVDDNPFEREMVRKYLPEVRVPELSDDPSDFWGLLAGLQLFETNSVTAEDSERTALYRTETARRALAKTFTDVDDYLRSLAMTITVAPFDSMHLPRIAQLVLRSNQFNLTTQRYSLAECQALMEDPSAIALYAKVSDRFGDHGLVSVVVLKKVEGGYGVDAWLMSCRVMGRGVETFLMNHVVELLRKKGEKALWGRYRPTEKNVIVKDFYPNLGFVAEEPTAMEASTEDERLYRLDLSTYRRRDTLLTLLPKAEE